jgi:DNA-binding transcriptional ArsR family regulator
MTRSGSRKPVGAPVLHRAVADLRALAHPLRLRMIELFAESPKTTKQVAELLGQPPTRLYHHVAALERAGLLVLTETRQNRGAVEKWYVGAARQLRAAPGKDGDREEGRQARRAVAATVLEQAKQEIIAIPVGAKEAALLARLVVSAPPSKIPAIRRHLVNAVQSLREEFELGDAAKDDACERWAVTVAFAPVGKVRSAPAKRAARPSTGDRKKR